MTTTPEQRAEIWREDARQAAVIPLLEQARLDGRAEGRKERDEHHAQRSQCGWDDAYVKGQLAAYAEAPSRFRWFVFGAVMGSAATIIAIFGNILWAAIWAR